MSSIYFRVLKHHQDAIQRLYGSRWVPQPYHFKMCKTLMESEVEGFEPYTPEEIIDRLNTYYTVEFWKNTRHDFANFCKHYDKFIPEKKVQQQPRISTRYCNICHTYHSINVECPEKRDVLSLVKGISKSA